MIKYLIDTDICIELLKRKFSLYEKVTAIGLANCFVSEITIAELLYGQHCSSNPPKHEEDVEKILRVASLLPISDILDVFAVEKARLRKSGQLVPDFDLLIGATAVHYDLVMVTNNTKHYERIQGIRLENWTLPEYNEFIG